MGKILLSLIAVFALAGSPRAGAADPELTEETIWSQHVINAYKSIQEQHAVTMRAVEQVRAEAEAAAKRQAEEFDARLRQLEQTVVQTAAAQRDHADANLATSQRFTLKVVGWSVAVGVVIVVGIVILLIRAAQRRAIAPFPIAPAAPLGAGAAGLAPLDPAQQSTARLNSSLDRLEQRLKELEAGTGAAPTKSGATTVAEQMQDLSGRVALLLGKGQALLNLQQADTALHCFDEIIALDPANAEAHVKKGAAYEKLGRLDEAIECYDRAIALDRSFTMAYLCKGGVFNRLERYGEAVECYEQALRAQQHAVG
jgi:tetratricopeptide (TPR) repeat protein